MTFILRSIALVLALISTGIVHTQPSASTPDETAINAVLKGQFEQPNSLLTIAPVSIAGQYAIVGWVQGTHGGRALLKKEKGQWRVDLCGGDGLKSESALVLAGVPKDKAHELVLDLERKESQLPSTHREKLSIFQGIVNMSNPEAKK